MKVMLIANKDITLYLFRKEFIEKLVKENYEVLIVCPKGNKLDYFKDLGCKIFNYELNRRGKNPFKELKTLFSLNKIIKRNKPDYIYTYTVKPNIYTGIISRFKKIKIIPTITGMGSSVNNGKFIKFIVKSLYKFSFRRVHSAVFQNKANLEWFKVHINQKVNSVLVNGSGVNLIEFPYVDMHLEVKTKFLFLGRIMKEKGIDELLEAITYLKNKYGESIEFNIAGFFEEDYGTIFNKYIENNQIVYHGYLEDTNKIISENHALILPSYHEGLSNVLLEAQATGRAVIASDIPGCIETFIDGKSGFSVKVNDVNDLIEKIEKFHNLPQEEKIIMGKLGRNRIENKFDRLEVVNTYFNLID